jgi:Tfp pilus assembly protein PilV
MVETIIGFIFLLIAHAAAGIYSSTLKYSKKTTYLIWGIWVVLQSGLLLCAEFLMTDIPLQFFVGFILSLVGQYVIFFLTTTDGFSQRIFTMLTYSTFFCISMTFFTMVRGTFAQMGEVLIVLIHAVLLIAMMVYFLCYVCPLCHRAARNITTGWTPLIFVTIVFLVSVILSSIFPVRLTTFSDPAVITFVFLSVSIFAVYPVIFSNINNMSEAARKKEVESQNNLLLTQIEAEAAQLAADSQARHDRRHHNLVMLEFANNNEIASIREYLKNLMDSDDEIAGKVRFCGNTTVNTVLSVYERRARQSGIAVQISAKASRELPILPQDLVIIIANLFENAIHAAAKLKNREGGINIHIKDSEQRLLIKVENPCKTSLIFGESFYGIGIRSVISTANKYDGMYDFTAEKGIFSAKISLNLK